VVDSAVPDPAADILSVGATSDGRSITVTLKLAGSDPGTPEVGHVYEVYLDDGEAGREFLARFDGVSPEYVLSFNRPPGEGANLRSGPVGAVKGVVDRTRNTVRMTAPLAMLGWKVGHRADLSAVSWHSVGMPGAGPVARDSFVSSSDFSDESVSYRVGTRGC
jgi:hypothetical protein